MGTDERARTLEVSLSTNLWTVLDALATARGCRVEAVVSSLIEGGVGALDYRDLRTLAAEGRADGRANGRGDGIVKALRPQGRAPGGP